VLLDVPTADEQGLAGFEANNWIGLFFPRNTPEPIVHQLHDATVKVMNTPALRTRMEANRHRPGEHRSYWFRLSQAFRQQRNHQMGRAN
jgi:tripartite-type tricarboxylate transporter receptor subunit TctC